MRYIALILSIACLLILTACVTRISVRPNTEWNAGRWGSSLKEIRADYHGYSAMSSEVDNAMGQIVKALKEKEMIN